MGRFVFTVTFNAGGQQGFQKEVEVEVNEYDAAHAAFCYWLSQAEWQVINIANKGEEFHPYYFKTVWVSGVEIERGAIRPSRGGYPVKKGLWK